MGRRKRRRRDGGNTRAVVGWDKIQEGGIEKRWSLRMDERRHETERGDKHEEMRGWERAKRRAGEEVKRGEEIRLLSFCLSVSLHPHQPHMVLPRTEICPVLKVLYHLVQTLNINQYSSYFIFSFGPWVASFNNTVMWPTGTHTHHNMIVPVCTESITFIYACATQKQSSHNVRYRSACLHRFLLHTWTSDLSMIWAKSSQMQLFFKM